MLDRIKMMDFMGIKVIETPHAVQTCYNFPLSKNRSPRLHKKLIKKFGAQTFTKPVAFMVHGNLNAHPDVLRKMVQDKRIVKIENLAGV